MSYYKYIVPLYGSSNPRLNRTLRSSSVERRVSSTSSSSATCNCGCAASRRAQRAASVGPTSFEYVSKDYSLLPHTRSLRASSLEPVDTYSRAFYSSYANRYQDYDRKVLNYAHKLDMEETTRELMNLSRPYRSYNSSPKPFSSNYDYYSSRKFDRDYLYNSNDVYSTYKHYRISNSTLSDRNQRAKSPLLTREIDRYYKPRPNYIGDVNPGPSQAFRHYNYRHIPYFGGSDYYQMMRPRRHI
eukprot:TRINITY_DN455_c0_g1_i1.p1 TRINITY_DN455_c0_g1~~TRINITY_DN455_c0_g1_i1.p1  ORF type:complete len:243 (+),score=77.11 TRINITY_DN455_c0_g1_i1:316-1044(+)